MKLCKKCGTVKKKSEFYKDNAKHDGLKTTCKLCNHEARKNVYYKNREQELADRKRRRLDKFAGM